jgi:hypothetical protein
MNKYKLEDKVKDFFDQREIKPSQRVWDKLNFELDNQAAGDIKMYFKEREIQPTSTAWDRIEDSLPVREKGRLIIFNTFRLRMVAAFLVALGTTAFVVYLNSEVKTQEFAQASEIILETKVEDQKSVLLSGTESTKEVEEIVLTQNTERILLSANINDQNNEGKIKVRKIIEESGKNINDKSIKITSVVPMVKSIIVADPRQNVELSDKSLLAKNTENIPERNNQEIGSTSITGGNSIASVENGTSSKNAKSTNRKYGIDASKLLLEAENKSTDAFLTKVVKGIQETSTAIYSVVSQRNVVRASN